MNELADLEDRFRAIRERDRNVLVVASAGTGKTRLVVDRLVELVAPTDGSAPLEIERIAAITFTRKAAGELRVRTRQRLLEEIATDHGPRAALLSRALGGVDTAQIGTIHGFADRLLRMWPAQARLDPLYTLDENSASLSRECFEVLVHAAETGALAGFVGGTAAEPYVDEAIATVADLQRAGLRLRSLETEHWTYHGLEGLVLGFVLQRDVDVPQPAAGEFDRAGYIRAAAALGAATSQVSTGTLGGRWLADTASLVHSFVDEPDPATIFREVVERLERGPRGRASESPRRAREFGGDRVAWEAWKRFDTTLRDEVLRPLRGWLATKLVRLRPVVLAVYERVKARRRVVDHLDLLLRLRDLLRDDRAIRRACQTQFDHIFVDEFQDTDPLQAEIVLFLCERGVEAQRWHDIELAPGKLTIVGDPKQSIYRFRRADLATYESVVELVRRSPHVCIRLTSSFRSAPSLVGWINERFADLLGPAYLALSPARPALDTPTVHAVAIEPPEDNTAAACRAQEAAVIARYVRWLVEVSGTTIVDPATGLPRAIRYGDIGVLAINTTNLPLLFAGFDDNAVPYASRGGALFLRDHVHRQFLLGLCALADRDDGVALAALLRPPFFAVDLGDLARRTAADQEARAIVAELRRSRFARSPGETARGLLEQTGFGRTVALGQNGRQRLASLRELCFQIEARALSEHLDFDGTMQRLHAWIEHPPVLDRPHPVGGDAVHVMTVHQAKGLEFPAVLLWDARAAWADRASFDPWMADRDGGAWALRLDMLKWEEPAGHDLVGREREMRDEERKRLVYVAATRARDLLVIPKVGAPDARWICGRLLEEASPAILEHELHARASPARWYRETTPPSAQAVRPSTTRDLEVRAAWVEHAREAAQDWLRPAAFTDAAVPSWAWGRSGRFGILFGETVHLAIGHALRGRQDPVARAARTTGLRAHQREATVDVARAIVTLSALGIRERFELEYAVSWIAPDGRLVSGYIDLIALVDGQTVLLDFKTDTPPAPGEALPERYIAQVRGYAEAIEGAVGTKARVGLLYTADGVVRWLS